WAGFLGILPIAIGLRALLRRTSVETTGPRAMTASVFSVASMTFANGGDNIAVYTPIFAGRERLSLVVMLSVFALLVVLLCFAAYGMVRVPAFARACDRWGHRVAPWVLVGLGAHVLFVSETFRWICGQISRPS